MPKAAGGTLLFLAPTIRLFHQNQTENNRNKHRQPTIMNQAKPIPPPWRSFRSSLRTWASAFVLLLATTWIAAAQSVTAPPVNTPIGNRATATYTDVGGTERTVTSNQVVTIVQQVAGLELAAPQNKPGAPGVSIWFTHTVTNTGNGPDAYNLTLENITGLFATDGSSNPQVSIYADEDDDGVPDNTTPITVTPQIPAGGTFKFVVVGKVASNAADGADLSFDVRATSTATTPTETKVNHDTIKVTATKALLTVTKSISPNFGPSPSAGDIVVTVRYQNVGIADAAEISLKDVLPAGMSYAGGVTWSERPGESDLDPANPLAGQNGNTLEIVSTGTEEVEFKLLKVPSGNSGFVTFKVTIDTGLNAQVLVNDIEFAYKSGSETTPIQGTSNEVQYTVTGEPGVEITFDPNPSTPSIPQGGTAEFKNTIRNTGNVAETFDITLTDPSTGTAFPANTAFVLYKSDKQTPLTDTDGNQIPDTGLLQPGQEYVVWVKASVPPNVASGSFSVDKVATGVTSGVTKKTTDGPVTITSSAVDLTNNAAASNSGLGAGNNPRDGVNPWVAIPSDPGSTVTFSLFAENLGSVTDTYDITMTGIDPVSGSPAASSGWGVIFKNGAATITNTGEIQAAQNRGFSALVSIPASQPSGSYDITFQIKSPTTGAVDTIVDRVTVQRVRKITLLPPHSGQIFDGGTITYVHTLTNNGNDQEDEIDLSVVEGISTWGTVLYLDDGTTPGVLDPGDHVITKVEDLPAGGSVTIIAKVSSPAGSAPGTVNPTTITATASDAPTVTSKVIDTTTVVSNDIKLDKLQSTDNGATFSANQAAAKPGDEIVYKLVVENTGALPAANVVIHDAVPAYTTYVANSAVAPTGVTPLYDAVEKAISFTLNPATPLQPGAKIEVTFKVRIDSSAQP